MRIVFLGTPDFAVPSLEALVDAGHEVGAVVTQPDRPKGRHRRPVAPPVKLAAAAHGLPVLQAENVNAPDVFGRLRSLAPDFVVTAAFGQKLGADLLALARCECLNVHASLLPRHRGAAPVAYAILEGDPETGVTLMRMAKRMDAGEVFAQAATPIGHHETTGELSGRLAVLGAGLLVRSLDAIAGGALVPVRQDPGRVTLAPSLRKADAAMPWDKAADTLTRFVRAMSPWPAAFTFWLPQDGPPVRLAVHQAEALAGPAGQPGRIASANADGIDVQTGSGLLRIARLQRQGKRPMDAADFLHGNPLAPGHLLGPAPPAHSERRP